MLVVGIGLGVGFSAIVESLPALPEGWAYLRDSITNEYIKDANGQYIAVQMG